MKKTTYLIGAGASYHSLPLIQGMPNRMLYFRYFIEEYFEKKSIRSKPEGLDEFLKKVNDLASIAKLRTSIDAHARELAISSHHDSEMELLKLKIILSAYLVFEQIEKPVDVYFDASQLYSGIHEDVKSLIDKRYITFWGDFLENRASNGLPNEVNIISWNYDMQFETSYSSIRNCDLEFSQNDLQVFPSPAVKEIDLNKSCILKVNGTAGMFDRTGRFEHNLFDLYRHKFEDSIDFMIELYTKNQRREFDNPLMNFAWETNEKNTQTRSYAQKIIEETEILIIIGYSFPRTNTRVDKEIFHNCERLKKVYYQVPKNDYDLFSSRLGGINPKLPDICKNIDSLDTFFIPFEI